jgi:hypothetical protein
MASKETTIEETPSIATSGTKNLPLTNGTNEVTYTNLKALGYPVCNRCKGQLRTDLDHRPFCPVHDTSCPLLSKIS